MLKTISIISCLMIFSIHAQAFIFGCGHGGTSCKGAPASSDSKVYDCFGSGAEMPELTLVKKNSDLDDGTVNIIANTEYFRNELSPFRELAIPGTIGTLFELQFFEESRVCNSADICLRITKADLGLRTASFILAVEDSNFKSMSFKCAARETEN